MIKIIKPVICVSLLIFSNVCCAQKVTIDDATSSITAHYDFKDIGGIEYEAGEVDNNGLWEYSTQKLIYPDCMISTVPLKEFGTELTQKGKFEVRIGFDNAVNIRDHATIKHALAIIFLEYEDPNQSNVTLSKVMDPLQVTISTDGFYYSEKYNFQEIFTPKETFSGPIYNVTVKLCVMAPHSIFSIKNIELMLKDR